MIASFETMQFEHLRLFSGELLREETLPAAGLTPSELASRLGVPSRGIIDLLRERRSVNPDLAHRLARVFKTTPGFWLRLPEAVDLWDACQANRQEYDQLKPLRERAA
jgi:addiction module HigA family antidote